MMETEQFILHQKDWVPNNERLPVLVYRGVVKGEGKRGAEDHGWSLAPGRIARESNDVIARRGWRAVDSTIPTRLSPARW